MTRGHRPDAPVFLVGFMGVGKTEVGALLATRLGFAFEDTDAVVERELGAPIESIFLTAGEGRFRDAEREALRAACGRRRAVVATGGGLFLATAARALIREKGVSVWLDADLPVIEARLVSPGGRPLWPQEDPVARRALFERRRATYALADVHVAAAGDPAEVAGVIEERLRALCR